MILCERDEREKSKSGKSILYHRGKLSKKPEILHMCGHRWKMHIYRPVAVMKRNMQGNALSFPHTKQVPQFDIYSPGLSPHQKGWKLQGLHVIVLLRVRWSPLCKGRHCHDPKHYSTSQDLLLMDLFPYLAQKNQLVAEQRWWVLPSSAPGQGFCRPEVSPPHSQKLTSALAGGLSKAPAALANNPSFELLTLSISAPLMKECLWSSSWEMSLVRLNTTPPLKMKSQ